MRIPNPTRKFIRDEAKKTTNWLGFYRWMVRCYWAGQN